MDTVHKIACFTRENKTTKQIIEVALWNEEFIEGSPLVTVAAGENELFLSIRDLDDLTTLIEVIKQYYELNK